MAQSGFDEATVPPGFRDGLTGLGWFEELDSEPLELEPDPEPELSESRAAPCNKKFKSLEKSSSGEVSKLSDF